MTYRDPDKKREHGRRSVAKLYASRRARGLCLSCGNKARLKDAIEDLSDVPDAAKPRMQMCLDCAVRRSDNDRKRRAAERQGGDGQQGW